MKTTLIEIGKKAVFSQFVQHPEDSINVSLAYIFGVD